ncbi:MAG TPA: aminoglycoside phosphotransferase family protein [Acidimicrobiales bacterium]|jgi:streptomycin 6-kinase|nr:aminoglycoside phosphotransferase family protein [Acidimicrobiales bacterium]
MATIPDEYRARLPKSWRSWAESLPELVDSYLELWELEIVGSLPMNAMYVVPVARSDGRQCVLKVQPTDVPGVEGARLEMLGLRLAGPAAVEVLAEDAGAGVLLLERAVPGTTLVGLAGRDDDLATETLAGVIADYGRPVEDPEQSGLRAFSEYAEAFETFDRGRFGDIPRSKAAARPDTGLTVILGIDELGTGMPALRRHRQTAERLLRELEADSVEPYLLHGDLHHENVLLDEARGHLVIDAWGLYGERAADVAPAMHNPIDLVARTEDLVGLFRRRLAIYSGVLGIDRDRLAAWCYAYDVIRTLWSTEGDEVLPEDHWGVRSVAALRTMI